MKVPVEIFFAAALIRIGHKLRIAISASNQSQGVWAAPAQAKAMGGISRIYNDPDHPSSVGTAGGSGQCAEFVSPLNACGFSVR